MLSQLGIPPQRIDTAENLSKTTLLTARAKKEFNKYKL